MIDMGVNWIKLSTGEILVDLREDTVAPGKMLDGTTAHDASGAPIEGNIPSVNGGTFQPTTAEQTIIEGGSYVKNDVKIAAATAGEDLSAEITEYGSLNDELEEVINSLPSAGGGGGSVETCTVTVINNSDFDTDFVFVTPTGVEIPYMSPQSEETFEVVKNSLFILYKEGWSGSADLIGDVQATLGFHTEDGTAVTVLFVAGNCTISGLGGLG